MINLRLLGLCYVCTCIGCAPGKEITSEVAAPWATLVATAEPTVWVEEGSNLVCHDDSDCPVGELCKPGRNRCLSTYPDPRILEAKPNEKEDCWLVDLYFSYHSTELAGEASRWLQYNIRCLRTRETLALVLRGHADGRDGSHNSQQLAVERGQAIKQSLLEAGFAMPIRVRGLGKRQPVPLPKGEKDYEYARRVEFWAL